MPLMKSRGISFRKIGIVSDRPSATDLRTLAAMKNDSDRKIPVQTDNKKQASEMSLTFQSYKGYFWLQEKETSMWDLLDHFGILLFSVWLPARYYKSVGEGRVGVNREQPWEEQITQKVK